jgi:ATP-dependent Lhr-like helicase
MNAFDRLAPSLQYHVVNTLGWSELRPVQDLTTAAVLDGDNCVVLAPTAGGKTEAAFFPLLSGMDAEDWRPVSVIYLSPIRALLNNQEARIARYADYIGRRSFKWHGDVNQAARKRFLAEPSDIILTTPESLEAMMISRRVPTRSLFSGLQAVVIDEIHAFAGDDRGAHLSALLERLQRFCGRDFQRIGLSASVGNPDEILGWLQGSSKRPGQVVRPPIEKTEPHLCIDYVGSIEGAAKVVAGMHQGKKRLVFVDSRRKVEVIAARLRETGVDTYLVHGSLAASERQLAERAFREGQNCVIVTTSAMELGIDIGDLDHVLQVDSPGSVASFLQRMGRTGRRAGTVPNCTFLCTKDSTLLEAAALVQLYREGFVEDVTPSRRASHIYAHQLLALSLQQGGVPRSDARAWLEGATAFSGLEKDDIDELIAHMVANEILAEQDGLLWLGPKGEKLYGRRNFLDLYAVFETPKLIIVRWATQEIGQVDAEFLATVQENSEVGAFTLGGRAWRVLSIDWRRGLCAVEPAERAQAARWSGNPRFLSYELCQAMRKILLSDDSDPAWSNRTAETIKHTRAEHAFLTEKKSPITDITGDGLRWWTFAGGRANTLLASMLEAELGGRCVVRNTSIDILGTAAESLTAVRQTIRRLHADGRPNAADVAASAAAAPRARLSKFEPCLPDRQVAALRAAAPQAIAAAANTLTPAQPQPEPTETSAGRLPVPMHQGSGGPQP